MLRVAARSSLSLGSAGDRLGSEFHGLAPEHSVSRDFHRSAEWMAQSRRLALQKWRLRDIPWIEKTGAAARRGRQPGRLRSVVDGFPRVDHPFHCWRPGEGNRLSIE